MARQHLGQMLVESGTITVPQLRCGLEWQRRWGGRIGRALVHLGMLREADLLAALGEQLGVPVVDVDDVTAGPELVRLVTPRLMERRCLCPVVLMQETRRGPLVVATADPLDVTGLDEASFASGKTVRPVLAERAAIERAIARSVGRVQAGAIDLPAEPLGEMQLLGALRGSGYWN